MQPGNFELCVAHNGQIQHWWRNNGNLDTQPPVVGHVTPPATFGNNIKHVWALIESSYGYDLEASCSISGAMERAGITGR